MRKLALLFAVAALGVPASASADGTSTVGAYGCFLAGGQVTRPAGTEIVARFGWAATNFGLVHDFLQAQTTTLSVNGGTPVDVSDRYGAPAGSQGDVGAFVNVPTGVVLSAGQSMTFEYVVSVSHLIFDGESFGGPGVLADLTCTVTGV